MPYMKSIWDSDNWEVDSYWNVIRRVAQWLELGVYIYKYIYVYIYNYIYMICYLNILHYNPSQKLTYPLCPLKKSKCLEDKMKFPFPIGSMYGIVIVLTFGWSLW